MLQRAIRRRRWSEEDAAGQQDGVREGIDRTVGHLATWLLCYCLITDLYLVAPGCKHWFGGAGVCLRRGSLNMFVWMTFLKIIDVVLKTRTGLEHFLLTGCDDWRLIWSGIGWEGKSGWLGFRCLCQWTCGTADTFLFSSSTFLQFLSDQLSGLVVECPSWDW